MGTILEIESTKAKAGFASLPKQAKARDVAITRHGHIQAYVLSPERYAHLASVERIGSTVMQKLENDFNALITRMQSPKHARAARRLATEPLSAILAEATQIKPPRKPRKSKRRD